MVVRSTWCEYLTLLLAGIYFILMRDEIFTSAFWTGGTGWYVIKGLAFLWLVMRLLDWIFNGAERRAINAHWQPIDNPTKLTWIERWFQR